MSQMFFSPYMKNKSKEVTERDRKKESSVSDLQLEESERRQANISLPWQSKSKLRPSASGDIKPIGMTNNISTDKLGLKKQALMGTFGGLFSKIYNKQSKEQASAIIDHNLPTTKSNSILRPRITDSKGFDSIIL